MARDGELIAACARNNVKFAQALLEAGSSPNVRHGFDQSTPLIEAVRANAVAIVRLLLSTEADVNAADRDGWTPLMLAVLAQDDLHLVGLILQSDSGVKVNQTRKNRESALTLAVARGSTDVVKLLVQNGAKCTARMPDGRPLKQYLDLMTDDSKYGAIPAIIKGGRRGAEETSGVTVIEFKDTWPHESILCAPKPLIAVQRALEADSDLAALQSWDKSTPLHTLCAAANETNEAAAADMVRRLTDAGAVNGARDSNGDTPILMACKKQLLDLAEALAEAGADMEITYGLKEQRLVHLMVMQGRVQSLDLLAELGADLSSSDADGRTALHHAASATDAELARVLLRQCADPNVLDSEMQTPLHVAAMQGRLQVCKELIVAGADLCREDKQGATALCAAAYAGQEEAVSLLIGSGADVHTADCHRLKTPLHWAVLKAVNGPVSVPVIELLVEAGADVAAADALLRSPLIALIHELADHQLKEKLQRGRTAHILCAAEALLCAGAVPDCIHEVLSKTGMQPPCGELVELLVKYGANPNAADGLGKTPLRRALEQLSNASVRSSDTALESLRQICGHLLAAGSNLQAFSAVISAAKGDPVSEQFFSTLINHGADINQHDTADGTDCANVGWTPVQEVVKSLCAAEIELEDAKRMIEWLLSRGAHIAARDATAEGDNVLHLLVRRLRSLGRHDTAAIFRALSKIKHCPLDQPNKRDITPLQLAIQCDDDQMVRALLERNCEPSQLHWLLAQRRDGQVSHDLLIKYSNEVIAHGAQIDEVDADGDSVFLKATMAVLNELVSQTEGHQFMQLLVREGCDTCSESSATGRNAMHLTATDGTAGSVLRASTARFLAESTDIDLDAKIPRRADYVGAGKTALHLACSPEGLARSSRRGEELELVDFLLKAGVDPNLKDENGQSAFEIVVDQLVDPAVKSCVHLNHLSAMLVGSGSHVVNDPVSLEKAYDASQLQLVVLLLSNGMDLKTAVHGSPVMSNIIREVSVGTVSADRYEFISELLHEILALGADPNVLHDIIAECHGASDGFGILEACLQHGADIEMEHPAFHNCTVLQQTVSDMNSKTMQFAVGAPIVKWLLHNNANPAHQCGENQFTVLHQIAESDHELLARIVIEKTENLPMLVNVLSSQGETALGVAAREGSESVASILLHCGVNPDLYSGSALPPIIAAARQHNNALVRLIAANGADLNVTATLPGGQTTSLLPALLQSSVETVDIELIHYLIRDLAADVTLLDSYGRTAMHYAISKALPSVLKLLLEHGGSFATSINHLDVENCTILHFAMQAYKNECLKQQRWEYELAGRFDEMVRAGKMDPCSVRFMRAPETLEEGRAEQKLMQKRQFLECAIGELMSAGSDVNAGCSQLPLAVQLNNSGWLKKLLNRGASVAAAEMNGVNLVSWLLSEMLKLYDAQLTDANELLTSVQSLTERRLKLLQEMCEMLINKMTPQTVPTELISQVVMLPFDDILEALLHAGCSPTGCAQQAHTPLHMLLEKLRSVKPHDSAEAHWLERRASSLVKAGADLARGDSLLFLALECERATLVELMIEHGVPLNSKHDGVSPVAYAFDCNSVPMTRLLLEAGADTTFTTASGQSPLCVAYKAQNEHMVQLLTRHTDFGEEGGAIFRAIIEEVAVHPEPARLKGLQQMAAGFVRRKASPNILNQVLRRTNASAAGIEFCEFLLSMDCGADPNFRAIEGDETPVTELVKLVLKGEIGESDGMEALEMLLTQGADANLCDPTGATPLTLAASGGNHRMVELLHSRGAAVDMVNEHGETALLLAVRNGHKNVVSCLTRRRANPNLRGGAVVPNMGPVHEACVRGNVSMLRELLHSKLLDVNARGCCGLTALHLCVGGATGREAIDTVHINMVEVLLGHKRIDVNVPDMEGNTVLHRAASLNSKEIDNIVRDVAHHDPNYRNCEGRTAAEVSGLQCATKAGNGDCSNFLSAAALENGVQGAFSGLNEACGSQHIRSNGDEMN